MFGVLLKYVLPEAKNNSPDNQLFKVNALKTTVNKQKISVL